VSYSISHAQLQWFIRQKVNIEFLHKPFLILLSLTKVAHFSKIFYNASLQDPVLSVTVPSHACPAFFAIADYRNFRGMRMVSSLMVDWFERLEWREHTNRQHVDFISVFFKEK
jgi:hypothetical protein